MLADANASPAITFDRSVVAEVNRAARCTAAPVPVADVVVFLAIRKGDLVLIVAEVETQIAVDVVDQ